jgi:hypothetical protein
VGHHPPVSRPQHPISDAGLIRDSKVLMRKRCMTADAVSAMV